MESLSEYYRIARGVVCASSSTYGPDLTHRILNDSDALGQVATAIMTADWKFNGSGTLHGYRKQRARWVINAIVESYNKNKTVVLDEKIPEPSFNEDIDDVLDGAELFENLWKDSNVSDRNKEIIRQRFFEDRTLQEIGDNMGITKERVRQIVDSVVCGV